MGRFGVLTTRKRAVIALIHSIVFLGVAVHGFVAPKSGILRGSGLPGDFVLIGIYLIVASILVWLVSISRGMVERTYFALCASSACSGLVRTIFGDQAVPAAQYIRVLMLSSAVGVGFIILRTYTRHAVAAEAPQVSAENSAD